MQATIDWTPDTIARLRALWDEGLSTAEIGRRLGTTKNAVVGKVHRLKLRSRPTPIRRDGAGQTRRPATRTPRGLPAEVIGLRRSAPAERFVAPPAPRPVRLGTSPCCWPLGEPGKPEFRFCGDPAVAGGPYCPDHCGLAYVRKPRGSEQGENAGGDEPHRLAA
jgi:GcrA cell cycle regulator